MTTQYVGSSASITPSIKYQKDLAECDVKQLKKQLKILSHKNLRTFVLSATTLSIWWNKESEILKSHLKCFSLEKHIGVRRKEDTVNHATSYEILCEKKTRE